MRKLLLIAVAFLTIGTVNAQNLEEIIAKSHERAEQLEALCTSYNACGINSIDNMGSSLKSAAALAIENSGKLQNLYLRQTGKNANGELDETVQKPTIIEWTSLAQSMLQGAEKTKSAVSSAKGIGDEIKLLAAGVKAEKNPLKLAKLAKVAKAAANIGTFCGKTAPILSEETIATAEAVDNIVQLLKAGKSL